MPYIDTAQYDARHNVIFTNHNLLNEEPGRLMSESINNDMPSIARINY